MTFCLVLSLLIRPLLERTCARVTIMTHGTAKVLKATCRVLDLVTLRLQVRRERAIEGERVDDIFNSHGHPFISSFGSPNVAASFLNLNF